MNYKMIALDLDGTLTNSKKKITPKTKDALMKLQKEGVVVVLASGRPTRGIKKLAEELELASHGGYILPYNGGQIIECATGNVLHSQTLSKETCKKIVSLAKKQCVNLCTYRGMDLLCLEKYDKYAEIESKINDMFIVQPDDFEKELETFDVPKFMMLEHPEFLVRAENYVAPLLADECECFCSAPYFLEICPKGIDKGASLDILLKHLGMERKDLVAVGDSFNDQPMIEIAGLGVCMGNGRDEIKAISDFVTLSNDEDGVAYMIEKFF